MRCLNHKTNMNGYYLNNTFHPVAKSFNELSRPVAQRIFRQLLTNPDALPQVVELLTGHRWPHQEAVNLVPLASFAYQHPTHHVQHQPTLLSIPGRTLLYGPSDALGNITYIEWMKVNSCLSAKKPDMEKAIAILWRPKKGLISKLGEYWGNSPDDDPREAYSDATLATRTAWVRKLAPWRKYMATCYIIGSRDKILEDNKRLFKKPLEGEKSNYGWDDILYQLSEAKNLSLDEIATWRFSTILFMLHKAAKQAKKK